jgi:DNA repair protein RecN (Recombination protein N)
MLRFLSITNYALIQNLEMSPSGSLSMITGETGAGKSIMLGAVGLLLGNRADTKALLDPDKKCVVEGTFSIGNYGLAEFFEQEELDYDPECIIRREISPSGKSRAFINDTPARLETLKDLGKFLMDVHSQHDTLLLGEGTYQLNLIDAFAGNKAQLSAYLEAYEAYAKANRQLNALQKQAVDLKKEADFNRFQLDELSALKLQEDEQALLETEQEILEHAEEIKAKIQEITVHLEDEQFGSLKTLALATQAAQQLTRYSHRFENYSERFQSALIELKDLASSLSTEEQDIEVDFEKLDQIRERLSRIYQLQQKHGVKTVAELILIENALADSVFKAENLDEELLQLQKEVEKRQESMNNKAELLSNRRKAVLNDFAHQLTALLQKLGMENAKVEFEFKSVTPSRNGADEIELLFSANKGIKPQAMKQVASGGEFSRLIFAIKYLMADKMALPTLIFDEIDTGVSGEIAIQMVRMMQDIAVKHQVICISHLPQVAAKGDQHYFVYKDNSSDKTVSRIKLLQDDERVTEIAKMIAGSNPSAHAYQSAKELLDK